MATDPGKIVGIDLGTTFSAIATLDDRGQAITLPNLDGEMLTPSAVLIEEGGAVIGQAARDVALEQPDRVALLVKRWMGHPKFSEPVAGREFRPETLSSLILRKLVMDAQLLAGPVTQAAITVPAYFNDPMRAATLRAGELAGLDVLGLQSEPTAAALAFGYDRRPAGATGVVVDLGGGTFDVTVMEYDGNALTVRATGGDAYLGGANFDKVLFDYFVEQFDAAHGLDINDPDALSLEECTQVSQDWLMRAARTKHDLTARDRTTAALQAGGLTLRVEVRRE